MSERSLSSAIPFFKKGGSGEEGARKDTVDRQTVMSSCLTEGSVTRSYPLNHKGKQRVSVLLTELS